MSGYPFWEMTLSGLIVSAPTIVVTVWLSTRSLKSHLNKVTGRQTTAIKGITDDQTGVLLSRRRPWWRPWA